ncbi:uncharacterized protein PGTG_12894 [Puccinia graminis f. sp. tritici CRL 75-36-700-3]|uniref:Uncharacterized protein n=1 Tax=Puccinia graminis f. sp. tritici (strain CRL 75-36-700-3 / race SCCL) TaxID=418459 RepID=E3KSM4_PUCGT|nr:uncharacterized protein PGTG_12894 [Puccinia graminis f. sp. tritici CRL 75-36-700-3]EFP87310.1 hypothetical protein PGTG_12894 [Puccinia graminis f. sp. tritici CRL 75-36-700-3]
MNKPGRPGPTKVSGPVVIVWSCRDGTGDVYPAGLSKIPLPTSNGGLHGDPTSRNHQPLVEPLSSTTTKERDRLFISLGKKCLMFLVSKYEDDGK